MNERAAFVALALTPGIGSARFATLLSACETPSGALAAPLAFLRSLSGMSVAAASAVRARSVQDGDRILEAADQAGATVLTLLDPEYPDTLRSIVEPPPVLFLAGRMELLRQAAVAVVGSRDHTPYGAQVCTMVAAGAARAGLAVVSGMARGLDAVAHSAALDAGGTTVGVLGNGIGVIYPAANRELYERLAADGLLLTEFPPGERPTVGSFPRRNRLISGLARVTVVVEAAPGSGALITAANALEQGREVMAVPGPITAATSSGTNALIRDGAHPLLELNDLFQFYAEALPVSAAAARATPPRQLPLDLDPAERAVAELLAEDDRQLDALAEHAGRSVGDVLSLLASLEIQGLVERRPGNVFRMRA